MNNLKMFKIKSLNGQLIFRFLMVFGLMLTCFELYHYQSLKTYLFETNLNYLDSRFRNIDPQYIVKTTTEQGLQDYAGYFLQQISDTNLCAVVINQEGTIVAVKNFYEGIKTDSTINEIQNKILLPKVEKEVYLNMLQDNDILEGYDLIEDSNGKVQMVVYYKIGTIDDPIGLIQISTYIEPIQLLLQNQLKTFLLSSLILLTVGGVLVYTITKITLTPLQKMKTKLSTVDSETLDLRLTETTGQIEVDQLSKSINHMIERLDGAFQKEKTINKKMNDFISDVSHELRTPLTSIQGYVEVLQMGAATNKEHLNKSLTNILSESQRLTKLVNQLLVLTRLEGKTIPNLKEENMQSVIEEIIPQLNIIMEKRTLILNIQPDLFVLINKELMKQVIYNLVQNAVKYTKEDGTIEIEVTLMEKQHQQTVVLKVKDNGDGIEKEKLPYLFDRFYRAHADRSRASGGYGLGLSIVKRIVEQHDAEIKVASELHKGTVFTIMLKKSKRN